MTYCLTKFLFTQCSKKQKSFTMLLCSIWTPMSLGSRPCFADNVVFNYSTVEMLRYFSYLSCTIGTSALSYCEQPWSSHSFCLCFVHTKGGREDGNTSQLCKFETEHLTQQKDFTVILLVRPASFV